MGNIIEAKRIIAEAIENNETSLNLSYLGLTDENLQELLTEKTTQDLSHLEELKLAGNQLTMLPDTIENFANLKKLSLYNNKIVTFPKQIVKLTNLISLNVGENNLQQLPESIGQLTNLQHLFLFFNQLQQLPESVGQLSNLLDLNLFVNGLQQLPESLTHITGLEFLELNNNPLSADTRSWLDQSFSHIDMRYNMAAFETRTRTHKSVLKELYKNDTKAVVHTLLKIDNLSRAGGFSIGQKVVRRDGKFITVPDRIVSGDVGLKEFLEKFPTTNDPQMQQVYNITGKYLLDQLNGPNDPDTQNRIGLIATCLGDCNTPVANFVLQQAIALYNEQPDLFMGVDMELIIEREAVHQKILKEIKLTSGDKQEEVQGLVNAIYLDTKAQNPYNKAKFTGDRKQLPSVTSYTRFAYNQVKDHQVIALAKMVGIVDDNGEPIQDTQGRYQIDPDKIKNIKNEYLINQGLVHHHPAVTKNVKEIMDYVQQECANLGVHADQPEVQELLDRDIHKSELEKVIANANETDVAQAANKYVGETKTKLAELDRKYLQQETQQPSKAEGHTDGQARSRVLSQLSTVPQPTRRLQYLLSQPGKIMGAGCKLITRRR